MSDYTKVFDGAAKDSGSATVLGADHDTEFDAIATAVNSKADQVASATAGNLAELSADGNLVDSGIASANLDGLTGVVETRVAALETSQDSLTPADAVTNHIRAWGMQIVDGSQNITTFDYKTNVTEGAFESLGPTGSGATNIYAEMDDVPSTARAILFMCEIDTSISTGFGGVKVHGAVNGVTGAINDSTIKAIVQMDADSGDAQETHTQVIIPCDSSQRVQIAWASVASATLTAGSLTYQGFIEDIS